MLRSRLLHFAALVVCFCAATSARAQDSIPRPLPWGISGAEAATRLEREAGMRIAVTRAGREVYAMSTTGPLQAVAVLAQDTLVGLIYFHPETHAHSASELFTSAVEQAERSHGPPYCRRGEMAVWPLDGTVLEIRVRRPRGDGARGAEVRYVRLGYESELARRSAAAAVSTPATPVPPAVGQAETAGVPASVQALCA